MLSGVTALMALAACVLISSEDEARRIDWDRDYILWPNDCNDRNPNIGFPLTWYLDGDLDDYGGQTDSVLSCDDPSTSSKQYVLEEGDCNDFDPEVNPGKTEICDVFDLDEDCNGFADNEDEESDPNTMTWFYEPDGDGDGHASSDDGTTSLLLCDPNDDYSAISNQDCNDENENVNPEAEDLANGLDDNCDGVWDEDSIYYVRTTVDHPEGQIFHTDPPQLKGIPEAIFFDHSAYGAPGPPRVTADGRQLAWITSEDILVIYSVESPEVFHTVEGYDFDAFSLSWRMNNRGVFELLFSITTAPTIHVWSPAQSDVISELTHSNMVGDEGSTPVSLLNIDVSADGSQGVLLAIPKQDDSGDETTGDSCRASRHLVGEFTVEDDALGIDFLEPLETAVSSCDAATTRWHPEQRYFSGVRRSVDEHSRDRFVEIDSKGSDSDWDIMTMGEDEVIGRHGAPYSKDGDNLYATVSYKGWQEIWYINIDTQTKEIFLGGPDAEAFGATVVTGW